MKKLMVMRKRRVAGLVAILVCAGLATLAWMWLSAPAIGTLRPASGRVTTVPTEQKTGSTEVVGESVSFNLPAGYKANAAPSNSANTETYTYTESKVGGALLAISIRPWSQSASADSSYQYRRLNPELYAEKSVTAGGATFTGFKGKQGGYEVAVWSVGSGKLATISLKAGSDNESYGSQLAGLLESWHWK